MTSSASPWFADGMANVLSDEKRQQVLALGRLGWSLRRIEEATGVRRETASAHLKAAGIAVRAPRRRRLPNPASQVSTDSEANPASQVSTDPTALRRHPDPVGPDNEAAFAKWLPRCAAVVCAWGVHTATFYSAFLFLPLYLVEFLQLPAAPAHAITTLALLAACLLVPLAGRAADGPLSRRLGCSLRLTQLA